MLDVERIRKDFPILDSEVNGQKLIYLDNAATTQLPECVLKRLDQHYRQDNANVHRGIHLLSERSTSAFEDARGDRERISQCEKYQRNHIYAGNDRFYQYSCPGLRNADPAREIILLPRSWSTILTLPWQRTL